jgi:hypothetical protein
VTLGVRPEDLGIAGDGDATDLSFLAAVEVVERLGSEILLDVAVGPTTMVASVEPTSPPRCTKPCASRSTPIGCISSTTRPKRRSEPPAAQRNHASGTDRSTFLGGDHDANPSPPAAAAVGRRRARRRPDYRRRARRHPGERPGARLWAGDDAALGAVVRFRAGLGCAAQGPITDECQKALGIKLQLETINANDIQARITSAIQSGSGPDIIMGLNNWPQLYAKSLADVSDVAEQLGKDQGGYYDICKDRGDL